MGHQMERTLKENHIKMTSKVKLPNNLIDKLTELPEQGMGYQVVSVTLMNGNILTDRRVVNSTYLLLLESEQIETEEILNVELSQK